MTLAQRLFNPRTATITGMIVLAALARLLPHPPNFTPVESMALFAGAWFASRRLALLVPIAAMLLSDLVLGLVRGGLYMEHLFSVSYIAVYACIVLCSIAGFAMRGRVSGGRVLGWSLAGAVIFFVVTNFAVWLTASAVPGHSACSTGLIPCYVAAIPFFQWSVLGALFWSALLFGGFELLRRRWPALRQASAA